MNQRRINIPVLVATLLFSLALTASSAHAAGRRVTITYWGYNYGDGSSSCWVVIGPQPPMEVVGEATSECDGTTSSWGLKCPDYTRESESCGPLPQSAAADARPLPAKAMSNAVAASPNVSRDRH